MKTGVIHKNRVQSISYLSIFSVLAVLAILFIISGCGAGTVPAPPHDSPQAGTCSVSGWVFDENHTGIQGASVTFSTDDSQAAQAMIDGVNTMAGLPATISVPESSRSVVTVTTKSDGSFTIGNLPAGTGYSIKVVKNGRKTVIVTFDLAGENTNFDIEITTPEGEGEVVFAATPLVLQPPVQDQAAVALEWSKSIAAAFGSYELYRSVDPNVSSAGTLLASISNRNTLTFNDTLPETTHIYYYRVFEKTTLEGVILLVGSNLVHSIVPENPETPEVTDFSPTGVNVPVDSAVSLTFSEAMDEASVEDGFTITSTEPTDPINEPDSGTVSWDGNTFTFTPKKHLAYSRTLTVTLHGATSAQGGTLPDLTWQFSTAQLPVEITPSGDSVSLCVPVQVTFLVPVDKAVVYEGTSLKVNDVSVAAAKSWYDDTQTVTFVPYGGLNGNTTFTIELTGFEDDAGNQYPDGFSWQFTTLGGFGEKYDGISGFTTGVNPFSVTVGDFNGDGAPDLATANYGSNNVSILLGAGDGTFAAAVNYGAGDGPCSVAVGDFNGDGKPDLAAANCNSDNVSILCISRVEC